MVADKNDHPAIHRHVRVSAAPEAADTVSVVIPCYNDARGLAALLGSLSSSTYKGYETIVVDDGSSDEQVGAVARRFNARLIRNERNLGIAGARNEGVKHSRGGLIIFFDSDICVYPDTVEKAVRRFAGSGEPLIMGVTDKVPLNQGFVPEFSALESHYFNTYLSSTDNELHTFCMAIRKSVFLECGGFNPVYKKGGEEWELGYVLSERFSLPIDRELIVRQRFDHFPERFGVLFHRVRVWMSIFFTFRRFGGKYSTAQEGAARISGVLFLMAAPISASGALPALVPLAALAAHLYLSRGFYRFIFKQKGIVFTVSAFFLRNIFGIAIAAGAACGVWDHLSRKEGYGAR
jgi:glycosyltransferase involved in cell wall biosynthesis